MDRVRDVNGKVKRHGGKSALATARNPPSDASRTTGPGAGVAALVGPRGATDGERSPSTHDGGRDRRRTDRRGGAMGQTGEADGCHHGEDRNRMLEPHWQRRHLSSSPWCPLRTVQSWNGADTS